MIKRKTIDESEKKRLIDTSFTVDEYYLGALDRLREDFESRGVDITSADGRRAFVKAVRELNSRFV